MTAQQNRVTSNPHAHTQFVIFLHDAREAQTLRVTVWPPPDFGLGPAAPFSLSVIVPASHELL